MGIAHTQTSALFIVHQYRKSFDCCQAAGFDSAFQKWFVSLANENNCKTDPKCCPLSLGDDENVSLQIA